jgi:hypothetical protein
MSGIRIGRISAAPDAETEQAIQEVATEMGNNLQYGTAAPDADAPGKVYFQTGSPDSNGWATVSTIYINTSR